MSIVSAWVLLNPGSLTTSPKNGGIPSTITTEKAANSAMPMRVSVGRINSATGASISVRAPAYQPRTCMNGAMLESCVARPQ